MQLIHPMSLKNIFLLRLFFFAKSLFHTMKVNVTKVRQDFYWIKTFGLFLTKWSHRFRRPHSQMDYFHDAFMSFQSFLELDSFWSPFDYIVKTNTWFERILLIFFCAPLKKVKSYRFRVNVRIESLTLRKKFTDVPPCSAGDLRCDALVCFSRRTVLPSLCCCWNRCPLLCHTAGKTRQLRLQKQRRHCDMELL